MDQNINFLSPDNFDPPSRISLEDELNILGLPVRLEHSLIKNYIFTVSDLLEVTTSDLLKFKNFGSKSVKFLEDIKTKIADNLLRNGSRGNIIEIEKESEEIRIPDHELIDNLLGKGGNERTIEIIKKRYGLADGEKHTLEEIGVDYRLTRERIRQILCKSLKRMGNPHGEDRARIIEKIKNIFNSHHYVINDEMADETISSDFSTSFDGSSFLNLLSDMGWIQNHVIGDVTFYSENIDLDYLMEKLVRCLKDSEIALSPIELCRKIPLTLSRDVSKIEIILQCLALDPRVEEKTRNYYGTYSKHGSVKVYRAIIKEILQTAQLPLHFTEISDKLNEYFKYSNKHIDVRRVHAVLIDDKMFAHTGTRGTYGLTEWGFRKITTPDLVSECLNKVTFPLHIDQIYDYVKRYKDIPKVNVQSVLIYNKIFEKYPKGFYGLTKNSDHQ